MYVSLPYLGTPPPFNCVPPPPFGQFKNKFGDTEKKGRQGSKLLGRRYLYHLPTGGLEEGYLGLIPRKSGGRCIACQYKHRVNCTCPSMPDVERREILFKRIPYPKRNLQCQSCCCYIVIYCYCSAAIAINRV